MLDKLTLNQLQTFTNNLEMNQYYEYHGYISRQNQIFKPHANSNRLIRAKFITAKYQDLMFIPQSPQPQPQKQPVKPNNPPKKSPKNESENPKDTLQQPYNLSEVEMKSSLSSDSIDNSDDSSVVVATKPLSLPRSDMCWDDSSHVTEQSHSESQLKKQNEQQKCDPSSSNTDNSIISSSSLTSTNNPSNPNNPVQSETKSQGVLMVITLITVLFQIIQITLSLYIYIYIYLFVFSFDFMYFLMCFMCFLSKVTPREIEEIVFNDTNKKKSNKSNVKYFLEVSCNKCTSHTRDFTLSNPNNHANPSDVNANGKEREIKSNGLESENTPSLKLSFAPLPFNLSFTAQDQFPSTPDVSGGRFVHLVLKQRVKFRAPITIASAFVGLPPQFLAAGAGSENEVLLIWIAWNTQGRILVELQYTHLLGPLS